MNLYRGCQHNCVYCDGRAEKYRVDGIFGEDVVVKINAVDILRKELDPTRKRTPFKKGYIGLGGGVGDSYQHVEKKYELTRNTLSLLHEKRFPVHILTKSTLVKRDIDLLKQINKDSKTIVSFSFSSVDDEISALFEPGVPVPSERLQTIKMLKKEGIATGMYLMPVIPFITDTRQQMEHTVQKAREAGINFIIFSGMTLKEGRQKEYFYTILKKHYPNLITKYHRIYRGNTWGNASTHYYNTINNMFYSIAKQYQIPLRIPHHLFVDVVDENDLIIVILEHMDYMLKMQGKKSPFGYAAYSLSKITQPLSTIKEDLQKLQGVGKITEQIIHEILQTKTSSYYESLLKYKKNTFLNQ
jgi:DNA repair photolyase